MSDLKQRPRVVVFTTSTLDRDKQAAMLLGADMYQTKTCEPDTFDRFAHWVSCMCAVDRKARARL